MRESRGIEVGRDFRRRQRFSTTAEIFAYCRDFCSPPRFSPMAEIFAFGWRKFLTTAENSLTVEIFADGLFARPLVCSFFRSFVKKWFIPAMHLGALINAKSTQIDSGPRPIRKFERPFTRQTWLGSAGSFAKACFRRFPTFHFSTPNLLSANVFGRKFCFWLSWRGF